MADKEELMTDSEVCEMLRISPVTLRKYLREGPPANRPESSDIRSIDKFYVGSIRRWKRESVIAFMNNQ